MRRHVEAAVRRLNHRVVLRRAPSFHELLCREHRICDALRDGDHGRPVHVWESKLGGKQLAESVGVRTAVILQGPCPAEEIDWEALPDRFVIKPTWGSAREGVMVVRRHAHGYRELLRGIAMSTSDLRSAARTTRGQLLAEEMVGADGDIPDDWKILSFNGHLELTLQIRRTSQGNRYKWYDTAWNDVGSTEYGMKCDSTLPPPVHPDALLDAATRLSRAAKVPFVRVDLYEDATGPVFGELTPRQSQVHRHHLAWDERLGRAWERAEVELSLERSGSRS